jgi:23S rRNA (guanosine2251-2'-O)-methyltransferase
MAILYNIRSIYNVGSIFRTADAVGVSKLYLCGITPDPIDRFGHPVQKLSKVALGAEDSVEWEHVGKAAHPAATVKLLSELRQQGLNVYAVEQAKDSKPFHELKLLDSQLKRTVLVFGAEVKGLPPSILKEVDEILEIPMFGIKESLNVSVAFGIVTYRLRCG